jgi:hypothetical protein
MASTVHHHAPILPDADETFIREHRDEILELAARFGIRDVKYASGNRLVGTAADPDVFLPTFGFMDAAEGELGRRIRLYSQGLADTHSEESDLHRALPL